MKIFKKYVNRTFAEEMVLVEVLDNKVNKIVMKGDYYHDKIIERIIGFYEGLYYCAIEHKIEETEYINPNHKLFKKFNFCDDN